MGLSGGCSTKKKKGISFIFFLVNNIDPPRCQNPAPMANPYSPEQLGKYGDHPSIFLFKYIFYFLLLFMSAWLIQSSHTTTLLQTYRLIKGGLQFGAWLVFSPREKRKKKHISLFVHFRACESKSCLRGDRSTIDLPFVFKCCTKGIAPMFTTRLHTTPAGFCLFHLRKAKLTWHTHARYTIVSTLQFKKKYIYLERLGFFSFFPLRKKKGGKEDVGDDGVRQVPVIDRLRANLPIWLDRWPPGVSPCLVFMWYMHRG